VTVEEHTITDRGNQPADAESAEELRARLEVLQEDYEALLVAAEAARERVDELLQWTQWQQDRLDHITGSGSWRLTAPLRSARQLLRRLSGAPREAR
jgi:hypothetical protein